MKKIGFMLIIAILVIGSVFAQERERGARRPAPELVTVEGTLQLRNGFIAVTSGESSYYVHRLNRLVGFIDGLREGSRVSIEGYVARNSIFPAKLTIDGRVYDFTAAPRNAQAPTGERNRGQLQGPGRTGPGRTGPGRANQGRFFGCCRW